MQLFKGFVDNNEIPDVGSYIEAFSKDFEALFKIHNFTIQKPVIPREVKKQIFLIRNQRLKEKEEDLRRQGDSDESEEEDEEEEKKEEEDEGVKRIVKETEKEKELEKLEENIASVAYNQNIFVRS